MNSFTHNPVLVAEVLAALAPMTGRRYLDGTLGGAGHAVEILKASSPAGWLLGIDRDGTALAAAAERLAPFAGRYELRHGTFDRMGEWVEPGSCDGVLLDLGVSSPQLDHPGRGFSFREDGPLDMRMDPSSGGTTAAAWVNSAAVEELERIFFEYGEEPRARRLARAIGEERNVQPLTSTRQLAALIERTTPRGGARLHPATRAFQALRMVVNDELGQLRRGLEAALLALRPGGRLAVITFHSLEVRVLKQFARPLTLDYTFDGEIDVPELRRPKPPELRWVVRRAQTASDAELAANPRARSAQLRVLERMGHGS
ncbi:MAG: 16S rRNA (cytosine(1402)-N(4))-methyltransferase RsmH [Verrucomicrobiales bacterium]|nr:16S rRNA (cytosine(1402)-N(4))-methyltransferase RsmH [Verrucomicrobiales bacterium]